MNTTLPQARKYTAILMGHLGTPRQQTGFDVLLKIQNIVKIDGKISFERSFVTTLTSLGKETGPEALLATSGDFYQIPEGFSTFEQMECGYAVQQMGLDDQETANW